MAFHLRDDGTLDTVVACEHCGHEERGNFDVAAYEGDDEYTAQSAYDHFVDGLIEDCEDEHECEHFRPVLESRVARGFDASYLTAEGVRVKCRQCEVLGINGVACHETGCPNIVRGSRGEA